MYSDVIAVDKCKYKRLHHLLKCNQESQYLTTLLIASLKLSLYLQLFFNWER